MPTIEAHFQVPEYIASGLQNGTYERVGGIVREHGTKQVVAWLRESAPDKLINFAPKLLHGAEAFTGFLNLGVSVCGFSLVLNRLNKLETRLRQSQEIFAQVDRKIDLSFYGNFVSAVQQANAAFQMNNLENRRLSAMQAIDRLLVAQHGFKNMVDVEIEQDSDTTKLLLPTLSLAYVAEARCCLELEEAGRSLSRLQEGMEVLQPRYKQYVAQQFADPKALFMHPACKDNISDQRLVSAYQWLEVGIEPRQVIERENEKLSMVIQPSSAPTASEWKNKWLEVVRESSTRPARGLNSAEWKSRFFPAAKDSSDAADKVLAAIGSSLTYPAVRKFNSIKSRNDNAKRDGQLSLVPQLPERFKQIETLVEDATRLEAYQAEVAAVQESQFTFAQWRDLRPLSDQQGTPSEIICITSRTGLVN